MAKIISYVKRLLLVSIFLAGAVFFTKKHVEKKLSKKPSSVFFNDESFASEFLRTLGSCVYQQADIQECLITAASIKDGDFESWYTHWYMLAEKLDRVAQDCYQKGHRESAKKTYLRASNYYRTAEFYLHGTSADPRIIDTSRKSRDCFKKVVELSGGMIEAISIPYEKTFLPGYFYRASSDRQLPTLIVQTGFDGTQEELYGYALEGVARGYNVVTFEGPGQGAVLREQKLPFRPDWQQVVTPVIDFLVTRPEVDKDRIALYGLSYGGYFAPRAASYDHRIKVLIANGGIFDLMLGVLKNFKKMGSTKEELIHFIEKHPTIFNTIVYSVMRSSTKARWFFQHGMYSFGVETPGEFVMKLSHYSLDSCAQNITATSLICDAQDEIPELAGQAKLLYEHLTCPKTYLLFKSEDGMGYHCQVGSLLRSNQVIFDWLDTAFASS